METYFNKETIEDFGFTFEKSELDGEIEYYYMDKKPEISKFTTHITVKMLFFPKHSSFTFFSYNNRTKGESIIIDAITITKKQDLVFLFNHVTSLFAALIRSNFRPNWVVKACKQIRSNV